MSHLTSARAKNRLIDLTLLHASPPEWAAQVLRRDLLRQTWGEIGYL